MVEDRLRGYEAFSSETIKVVGTLAKELASYTTYQELFDVAGIREAILYVTKEGSGVPVLDIPARKKRSAGVLVFHLPMGNPLDPNQLYNIASFARMLPGFRIIAFGNQSGKPYAFKQQNLTFRKRFKIAFTNDRRPLVEAEIDYLTSQKLTNTYHIGYSYGATKALILCEYAPQGLVSGLTCMEPVAHPRSILQLFYDFTRSALPLGKYVDRTELPTYLEARRDTARTKHHVGNLSQPLNFSIGLLLRRFDFIPALEKLVADKPTLQTTTVWGTKSELGNDSYVKSRLHNLAHAFPDRVHRIRLEDAKHAFANDVHLGAAVVYESLKRSGVKL